MKNNHEERVRTAFVNHLNEAGLSINILKGRNPPQNKDDYAKAMREFLHKTPHLSNHWLAEIIGINKGRIDWIFLDK